jgi:hypothetical protein
VTRHSTQKSSLMGDARSRPTDASVAGEEARPSPGSVGHACDEWCWVAVWHGTEPATVFEHGNLIEVDHGCGQVLIERRCSA